MSSLTRALTRILAVLLLAPGSITSWAADPGAHPSRWPAQEREHYLKLQVALPPRRGAGLSPSNWAEGSAGIIGSTTDPFAVHAGLKVLQEGGNAVDAAVTTALTQIALSAGSAVSFAGLLDAVYYDAASGKVYSLNAGFNSVRAESDPASIPREPSGRTALVPGFMAGVQALHDRFGTKPLSELLGPAIWVAEKGMPVSPILAAQLRSFWPVLSRRPETKAIFAKDQNKPYAVGEILLQPALAKTLRQVAKHGAKYMYQGEWAQRLVTAVRSDGGKMTLADLELYRPLWSEPLAITYGDSQVLSIGGGHAGARHLLGTLKAASLSDLNRTGHFASSPGSLFQLIQIERSYSASVRFFPGQELPAPLPDVSGAPEDAASTETAERVVAYLKAHRTPGSEQTSASGTHSAVVVAADSKGNVISLLHSINTSSWGLTGIFVDGVSIPDAGLVNRKILQQISPGARVPDPTNPVIVLRQGKPFLAAGAIGMAPLSQLMLQTLVSIIEFGMEPKQAVTQPYTRGPMGGTTDERDHEVVLAGAFPESVIDGVRKLGQPVAVVPRWKADAQWIGIQVRPSAGEMQGAASPALPALLEAY
jgi:gamma-glutamyltranspeptidase / glutathione hydrolase